MIFRSQNATSFNWFEREIDGWRAHIWCHFSILFAAQVKTTQQWLSVATQIEADRQQLFQKWESRLKKWFSMNYSNHKSDANYHNLKGMKAKQSRHESRTEQISIHSSINCQIIESQWNQIIKYTHFDNENPKSLHFILK